jgi:hypothetical protein
MVFASAIDFNGLSCPFYLKLLFGMRSIFFIGYASLAPCAEDEAIEWLELELCSCISMSLISAFLNFIDCST